LLVLCTWAAPADARGGRRSPAALELQKLAADIREQIQRADYPAAEKLARRRLDLSGRSFGEVHRIHGRSLLFLGRVLYFQGRYQEAEALLRRALLVHERAFGSSDNIGDDLLPGRRRGARCWRACAGSGPRTRRRP
jgi:tetratricopeptide (TPR) repeat protein